MCLTIESLHLAGVAISVSSFWSGHGKDLLAVLLCLPLKPLIASSAASKLLDERSFNCRNILN